MCLCVCRCVCVGVCVCMYDVDIFDNSSYMYSRTELSRDGTKRDTAGRADVGRRVQHKQTGQM